MAVVISGANFNKEEQQKAASINYKNNTGAAGSKAENVKAVASGTLSGVDSEGAVVSKGDRSGQNQDATYKSLLSEADDVKSQIMASATNAKDSLKALFNKLSGAEAVKIDEDGFNLTRASAEDCVNIVEKIKIELAMHCEDYVPSGTPIDSSKIEQVTGSAGMANTVADRMSNAGIVDTTDNENQVTEARDMAAKMIPMSENVKNYMVKNNIEPSIDGIYQAEHAVSEVEKLSEGQAATQMEQNGSAAGEDGVFDSLRSQIEQVIQAAGLEVNNQNLNNAKAFLENDIPVTKENLAYKAQLDQIDLTDMSSENKQEIVLDKIMANMVIGESAGSTLLTEDVPIISQVADVIDTLNKSDINTIETVTANVQEQTNNEDVNTTFTIQDLKDALQSAAQQETQSTAQVQANYTMLQEIRILMTAEAGVFLAKQGTNLYTTSVYELSMQLKAYDQTSAVYDDIQDETEKNAAYTQVFAVKQAMYKIAQAPETIIGQFMTTYAYEERFTIAAFAQSGSSMRQQYERAGKDYDAVGTQVRKDLGDSMDKAVENSTETILRELGLEDNKNNRAAVRILAANEMEMTSENIAQVKELYETLNHLIENMKPETVLSMIRENVNPLTDDIGDVNTYLMEMNDNATEDNTEKYSKFLYKLDNTDGISQEERSKFIEIYKLMNIFTKDAGNAIGALVKQGADITMDNLMTAYASRKSYGMNVTLDTDAGMAEITGTVNYYQSLFANTGDQITPNTLLKTQAQQAIDQRSVENFCDAVEDYYDADVEAESLEGYIDEMRKSVEVDQRVFRQLEIAGETVSINNLQAAEQIISSGVFPKINGKNVSDGIEKIGHREELQEFYEELSGEADEALQQVLESDENQTYSDLSQARMSNHEIGYIKNLAVRNDYHIPVETDNETAMIHLTLVQDEENQGRISVEMNLAEIGQVSLEAKVSEDKTDIFVMHNTNTQTEEAAEELQNRLDTMETAFSEIFQMEQVNIYQSGTERMPERFYPDAATKTATEQLYSMAQVMVKILAGRNV